MILDGEKCRAQLKGVLAGEMELAVEELWPLLYYVTCLIHNEDGREDKEYIAQGMVILEKLLRKADPDDDMETVMEAVDQMMGRYAPVDRVLDMLAETGYSFTEACYKSGNLTNLRDFLLESRFSLALVRKMAELGIDLNEPLIKGRTPACILTQKQRKIGWGADKNHYEESLAEAVEEFFDVESLETLNADGVSAAHLAVRQNHYEVVEAMLRKGVNVNLTEDKPSVAGTTFLHIACEHGYPRLVEMLMDAGADDTLKNEQEETPAHIAVSKKIGYKKISDEERVQMLRALKNIDIPGRNGVTPLMLAQDYSTNVTLALTPVLIEKGADVNRADNNGNTALMLHTYWHCYKDVVKAMVKGGYDINARNREGDTVLHYVLKDKSSEMAVYLIKKGADVNIANEKGVTPLQLAVENGLDEVLDFMGI